MREFLTITISLIALFATYDVYQHQQKIKQDTVNFFKEDYAKQIYQLKEKVKEMVKLNDECSKQEICIGSNIIYNEMRLYTSMINMNQKESECESNHDLVIHLIHNIKYDDQKELARKISSIEFPKEVKIHCED